MEINSHKNILMNNLIVLKNVYNKNTSTYFWFCQTDTFVTWQILTLETLKGSGSWFWQITNNLS